MAALQIAFHAKNNSCIGERTYIYGPSKSNVVSCYYTCVVFKIVHFIENRRVVVSAAEVEDFLVDRSFQGDSIVI